MKTLTINAKILEGQDRMTDSFGLDEAGVYEKVRELGLKQQQYNIRVTELLFSAAESNFVSGEEIMFLASVGLKLFASMYSLSGAAKEED